MLMRRRSRTWLSCFQMTSMSFRFSAQARIRYYGRQTCKCQQPCHRPDAQQVMHETSHFCSAMLKGVPGYDWAQEGSNMVKFAGSACVAHVIALVDFAAALDVVLDDLQDDLLDQRQHQREARQPRGGDQHAEHLQA